jgi:glutamate N-acetyltransferase/amino-acid N-acetyltransferase
MRVEGFRGSAVQAAIRHEGRLDLGLIVSDRPAALAGVFTSNEVKAAPVLVGMERLREGPPYARAIVVNSGNANACTGAEGVSRVREICSHVAQELGILPEDALMCSTGVIGEPLPIERIREATPSLIEALSDDGILAVARAILTTDTVEKTVLKRVDIGGVNVTVAGLAKGSGMIGPRMGPPHATMLAFLLSDAVVDPLWFQAAVERSASASFNRITVDGDTSTNDTVLALANGAADNEQINERCHGEALEQVIREVMQDLARQIVQDGEGATKCVTVVVKNARSVAEADSIARTIAESPLVKTAFFGQDPNWGRIMAAAGRAGFPLEQSVMGLAVGGVVIVKNGQGVGQGAEARAKEVMAGHEFSVVLDLGLGEKEASILTCDLSVEYVRINANYRT